MPLRARPDVLDASRTAASTSGGCMRWWGRVKGRQTRRGRGGRPRGGRRHGGCGRGGRGRSARGVRSRRWCADGTDATRGTTMGGIMHVDAPRPQNGAGAVATGAPGAAGSGGSGPARAAKYNMATLEERTRFKQRTALPGLRWGKVPVPGEHDQRTLPDARRRVRSLSLLSLPRALCARSDQTVETVDWTKSWPPSP